MVNLRLHRRDELSEALRAVMKMGMMGEERCQPNGVYTLILGPSDARQSNTLI